MECTLTANVDILDQAPEGWQISLLDNPGFGESFQEKLMLETEMTMKTSSAYLYIMDAGQLSDKEDERCLDLIHRSDEGIYKVNLLFSFLLYIPLCRIWIKKKLKLTF